MVETLCSAADVQLKAGNDVSSDLTSGNYTTLINQAEAYIMAITRIDWVTLYSTLNSTYKIILNDAASSRAAMAAIAFDMSGYGSRANAQTAIDVNYTLFLDAIKLLKEKYTSDFIQQT